MKKRLLVITALILVVASVAAGYFFIHNKSQKDSIAKGFITETVDVNGKKVEVTLTRPKAGTPYYIPARELKTKEDFILEAKDLKKIKDITSTVNN